MKYTLRRINLLKTSCIVTLIAFICSYPLIGLMQVFSAFAGNGQLPWIVLITLPLLIAALSFFFTVISCFIYNATAKVVGGITIEIEQNSPK
ncbi:MAG: hypothetical protein ACRC6G_04880 [Deefgea sp.]